MHREKTLVVVLYRSMQKLFFSFENIWFKKYLNAKGVYDLSYRRIIPGRTIQAWSLL